MRAKSLGWAIVACVAAACGHLAGDDRNTSHAADAPQRSKLPPRPRQEAGTQPLPTITVATRLKPAKGIKLHSSANCDTKECSLEVLVQPDCSMDLSPQWLALDRSIDSFTLHYVLGSSSAQNATLTSIHEKHSKPSNPNDLFHDQKVLNEGREIVVENVANHFIGARHYDIEAAVGGKACTPLDPPVMPDY